LSRRFAGRGRCIACFRGSRRRCKRRSRTLDSCTRLATPRCRSSCIAGRRFPSTASSPARTRPCTSRSRKPTRRMPSSNPTVRSSCRLGCCYPGNATHPVCTRLRTHR
jgi:hypothetical protein